MRKTKRVFNSNPEKERFWLAHQARWKSSGVPVSEYCQSNGISKTGFYYWQHRLEALLTQDNVAKIAGAASMVAQRTKQPKVAPKAHSATQLPSEFPFVPVKLLEPTVVRSGDGDINYPTRSNNLADQLEVTTPRGYRIRVSPDTNLGLLSILLFTLEHQQC